MDFFLKNLWFDTLLEQMNCAKQIISGTQKQKLENLGKRFRNFEKNPSQICSLRKLVNFNGFFSLITVFTLFFLAAFAFIAGFWK